MMKSAKLPQTVKTLSDGEEHADIVLCSCLFKGIQKLVILLVGLLFNWYCRPTSWGSNTHRCLVYRFMTPFSSFFFFLNFYFFLVLGLLSGVELHMMPSCLNEWRMEYCHASSTGFHCFFF